MICNLARCSSVTVNAAGIADESLAAGVADAGLLLLFPLHAVMTASHTIAALEVRMYARLLRLPARLVGRFFICLLTGSSDGER